MPGTTESVASFRIKQASDRIQSVIGRKLGLRIYQRTLESFCRPMDGTGLRSATGPSEVLTGSSLMISPATLEEQAEYYNERGVIVGYADRGPS